MVSHKNTKGLKNSEQFVSLLAPSQRRIQAFILMLVPNINDAEDIYQEVLVEIWNKFDTFQLGTDFVAWSITIAKYKVLTFKSKSCNSKIQFSSKITEIIESAAIQKSGGFQDHLNVLRECFKRLSTQEVSLLRLRYEEDMTFQKISLRVGKASSAIHRMISAVHAKLALCIRRSLRQEEIA